MITGTVNASREAVIRLSVLDTNGQPFEFDAIVDTGFNGSLTLPPDLIHQLSLVWHTRGRVTLATGAEEECDIYTGVALWDGQAKNILIEVADTEPLVGMRLMYGCRIIIEDIDGGMVMIEALPLP